MAVKIRASAAGAPRARKTEPVVRKATCHITTGTDTRTTEHRGSGRTIRGSRRTARRRVCRAAGRHQRVWLRLDWTVPFRERVGVCSKVPKGVEPDVSIKIRISFNRDGTLVSPPRLLVPAPTAKQQALMESAVDALERCQPFTMLPAEKYKQWKTMVVYSPRCSRTGEASSCRKQDSASSA